MEAAEQKTSKLLVVVCCCKTVEEGMATEEEIINVLKTRDLYTDVTLTGRGKLPGVFEMADTIYNLVPEKVPSP